MSPGMTCSRESTTVSLPGVRTNALTLGPRRSAWDTSSRPVLPVAPKIRRRMLAVRKYSAYGCAEGNSGQDKPDRVKSVPPVAKVCPVRGKPLGRPRIDKLVDRVNPDGPNSHHEHDAGFTGSLQVMTANASVDSSVATSSPPIAV